MHLCSLTVYSRCKGEQQHQKVAQQARLCGYQDSRKVEPVYEEKLKEMETKLDDVKERIIEVEKAKPTEAAWMIKEQVQQQRITDDRKANMMIFNVTEEMDGKAYFLNLSELCGLKEDIGTYDIVEVKPISEPGAHVGDKPRPILVNIISEDKKKDSSRI